MCSFWTEQRPLHSLVDVEHRMMWGERDKACLLSPLSLVPIITFLLLRAWGTLAQEQCESSDVWMSPIRFEAVPTVPTDAEVVNKPNPTGDARWGQPGILGYKLAERFTPLLQSWNGARNEHFLWLTVARFLQSRGKVLSRASEPIFHCSMSKELAGMMMFTSLPFWLTW